MLTPVLYTFSDSFMGQTDLFYDDGNNLPQEAAAKLQKTNILYDQSLGNYGECFRETSRTAEKIKTTEHLNNIRWFYTLEKTPEHLTMTVITLCPTNKTAAFFKGSLNDFMRRFSPASKPLTGIYTFYDDGLHDPIRFFAGKENNPSETAFRFKNMEKLYNVSTMTYPAAFIRANHDVEFVMTKQCADYLYTLQPSEDEDTWEEFTLKAYSRDTESRLFFQGSLAEFITLYAQG